MKRLMYLTYFAIAVVCFNSCHKPSIDGGTNGTLTTTVNGQSSTYTRVSGKVLYQPNTQTDWPDSNVLRTFFPPNKQLTFSASSDSNIVGFEIRDYSNLTDGNTFKTGTYLINDSMHFVTFGGVKYYSSINLSVNTASGSFEADSGSVEITVNDANAATVTGIFHVRVKDINTGAVQRWAGVFDNVPTKYYTRGNASNSLSTSVNGQTWNPVAFGYGIDVKNFWPPIDSIQSGSTALINHGFQAATLDGTLLEVGIAERNDNTYLRTVTYQDSTRSTDMVNGAKNYSRILYFKNGRIYKPATCSVTISAVDPTTGIISGSFSASGDSVDITNGTFTSISTQQLPSSL